jgi:hypothetical protein
VGIAPVPKSIFLQSSTAGYAESGDELEHLSRAGRIFSRKLQKSLKTIATLS